jgi:hypothetical protein
MNAIPNFNSLPNSFLRSAKAYNIIQMMRHGPYRYLIQLAYDGMPERRAPYVQPRDVEGYVSSYVREIHKLVSKIDPSTIWDPICGIALVDKARRKHGAFIVCLAYKDHDFFQKLGSSAGGIFSGIVKKAWPNALAELEERSLVNTKCPRLCNCRMGTDDVDEVLIAWAKESQSLMNIGPDGLF